MKKLLVIAVALASVNAFASRARVTALANSPHLTDVQTIYTNPADIFAQGSDFVTLESGASVSTATAASLTASPTNNQDGAEGLIVRSMGDAKMGLSLGHDSDNAILLRKAAGLTGSIATQQNPVELTYGMKAGDLSWAGTFVYSNFKDKVYNAKEDTMGLRGGIRMGNLDASLRLGLANNASSGDGSTAITFKGTTGIGAGVGYQMDNIYFAADLSLAGYKKEVGGVETNKVDTTTINLSATTAHKKDGSEFFYGAGLTNYSYKDGDATTTNGSVSKISRMSLPVWIGLEVDAASWLALRGSVSQSILINDSKTETSAATAYEASPSDNNTTFAAGAGLKFNKVTLDGTILTGGTQTINGNNLLAQAGMTYMF